MMELQRSLSFVCCGCGQGIEARVLCTGQGLLDRTRPVAAALVPCPHCGRGNQVLFEPKTDVIHAVRPGPLFAVPAPSAN